MMTARKCVLNLLHPRCDIAEFALDIKLAGASIDWLESDDVNASLLFPGQVRVKAKID